MSVDKQQTEMTFFLSFVDSLSNEQCQSLIKVQTGQKLELGKTNSGETTEVRSAYRASLPLDDGICPHMIGLAFLANQLCWKYDLTHCDQSEFLMYGEHNKGKYDPHIDTLIGGQHAIDRKLTVLAFLSDPATYDGGRLFLQWSHERYYIPQTLGKVLVFPSFIMHGVEPVTRGVRHSAVCWIEGPRFK